MLRPLLIAGTLAALAVTILGGIRHDYIYYIEQWQLVLAELDPWSTNSAYGPLHNLFALLLVLHPLAPKLVTAAALLAANAALLFALERTRPARDWRLLYLLSFGANALPWISVFWFGNNDGFVAALLIAAVLARLRGATILAGVLIGLATLDKYYPALLIPLFALDERRLDTRLILGALLTIAIGMGIGFLLWGTAMLEAISFGVSRDAMMLSIFNTIAVIGRANGFGEFADLLVRLNTPLLLLVWLGAIALVWRRRDHWLVASCWGLFAVLLAYKVGNQQFWVSWLALTACLPLLRRPDADLLAGLSLPYATFLSLFQLGFAFMQPEYFRGSHEWIKDYAGIPSFVLGITLLVLFLRRPTNHGVIPAQAGIQTRSSDVR